MSRRPRPKAQETARALEAARGVRSAAANALGISTAALGRAIARSKRLQALEAELAQANRDLAETKLLAAVEEGKVSAIIFYLRQKEEGGGMAETRGEEAAEAAGLDLGLLSDAEIAQLERLIEKASAARGARAAKRPRARPRRDGQA